MNDIVINLIPWLEGNGYTTSGNVLLSIQLVLGYIVFCCYCIRFEKLTVAAILYLCSVWLIPFIGYIPLLISLIYFLTDGSKDFEKALFKMSIVTLLMMPLIVILKSPIQAIFQLITKNLR